MRGGGKWNRPRKGARLQRTLNEEAGGMYEGISGSEMEEGVVGPALGGFSSGSLMWGSRHDRNRV